MREEDSEQEEVMELTESDWEDQRLVGAVLRKRREALGMTPAETAEKMGPGYTEELVSQYEAGSVEMHIGPVFSMIEALRITPEDIDPKRIRAELLTSSGYLKLNAKSRKAVDQFIARMLAEQGSAT